MTKFEAAKKHIKLREIFYQVKFNIFQRAYAHAYMVFHKQTLIEGANEGLEDLIRMFGNVTIYRKKVEGV